MAGNQEDVEVFANIEARRFEVKLDGHTAFLQYSMEDNSIVFSHTEVPREIGGRGVGGALARAGLAYARREGLHVVPLCSFVEGYLRKHPGDLELVEPGYRKRLFPESAKG